MSAPVPDPIQFSRDGLFFDHVIAFMTAVCAVEPLGNPANPLKYYAGVEQALVA
jgi:hypothetical protein